MLLIRYTSYNELQNKYGVPAVRGNKYRKGTIRIVFKVSDTIRIEGFSSVKAISNYYKGAMRSWNLISSKRTKNAVEELENVRMEIYKLRTPAELLQIIKRERLNQ